MKNRICLILIIMFLLFGCATQETMKEPNKEIEIQELPNIEQEEINEPIREVEIQESIKEIKVQETQELPKEKIKSPTCQGGRVTFEYPPVNLDKTAVIVPLGLMTGSHVTPVDHQYFQNFANDKSDIEVYSPGSGIITHIQHMVGNYFDNGEQVEVADFRVVIEHTCTISSIYIHIDELSEKIAQHAPKKGDQGSVKIPVEAGEIIGTYSRNVDYNIVDQEVILPGLLVPEHYEREPWKIHVPDTLDYFTEPIKNKLIEKSLRTAEPISGKFDYDIDGKLRGNWFEEGTNGYQGTDQQRYWSGHLSISPNYLDPNHIIVSMGDYEGTESQMGVKGNSPDPAKVDVSSGITLYELVPYDYYTADGRWDRTGFAKIKEAKNYDQVQGVILLQLIEDRKLKVEIFPEKTKFQVNGFTNAAKIYER